MRDGRYAALLVFLSVMFLLHANAVAPQPSRVFTESYFVPSRDPGIQLYVRNKHPEGGAPFRPDRILLFVHGATFPSEATFDLSLGGLSWMDYIAQRGWDVYLMDVRGYGGSTRPREMSQPATANPPIVNTDVAVKDVAAVVDHILVRRRVPRIDLMGWSWGTMITGIYTTQNSGKVGRLVLYAPLWLRQTPRPISTTGSLGAYRSVAREQVQQRWLNGVPDEKQWNLIPPGWLNALWKALLESDPVGAAQAPPVIRAPNGVLEDLTKYMSADSTPYYDPAQITVPVLIIQAEWDSDAPPYMSRTIFAKLTRAPVKRYVMIGEGTHFVMMERNRMQLFREVQGFLEEPR